MKRVVAGAITGLILTALLVAATLKSRPSGAETPEQCLDQMYQAMKDGNVAVYLRCFSTELRERLERLATEQTAGKFGQYLKQTAAPIKGRALYRSESAGTERVRLRIDRVYEGRPWEYQAYRLQREADGWKIYDIEPPELHEPQVPYGTPAFLIPDQESNVSRSADKSR